MTTKPKVSRRELLINGGMIAAGISLFPADVLAQLSQLIRDETPVDWIDEFGPPRSSDFVLLDWNGLESWITPVEQFFSASHYPEPSIDRDNYKLEVGGAVRKQFEFGLDQIKKMPRKTINFTLECSGNRGFPIFRGGVYNATWTGTSLAAILKQAGIWENGLEVVFFGYDEGEEVITPRRGKPLTMKQNFARSLSIQQAMDPDILLCYEVNGQELPPKHGFPLRLIVPGWYGISQVKWLKRIEVRTSRYMGRFISRDYVTIREETHNEETVWRQESVGQARINSVPARVTRVGPLYRIYGAAWGEPLKEVQVRIDDGRWNKAEIIEGRESKYSWKFWRIDWERPPVGKHTITSRGITTGGTIQPTPDDPYLAKKRTYWESNGQVTRTIETYI